MMQNTFLRRLFYYLIGVGIGLIFVFFVFGNRGCSWLPQNKVKETITHKILVNGSKKISANNIKKILEESEVNFDKSNKNTPFKTYLFESTGNSSSFYVSFHSDSYFAVVHDDINQLKVFKTDTFLKIINLPEEKFSLFNFDVSQQLLNSLKSANFTRESYVKTLSKNGFLTCNLQKNNSTEAEFLLKNESDSTFLMFTWKDVMLTPTKVVRNN
ncbi:MAG: hypothetical protein ACKO7D_03185 [Bacteroidota bacterium]